MRIRSTPPLGQAEPGNAAVLQYTLGEGGCVTRFWWRWVCGAGIWGRGPMNSSISDSAPGRLLIRSAISLCAAVAYLADKNARVGLMVIGEASAGSGD